LPLTSIALCGCVHVQIQLYFPENGNAQFGVLRSIVKDSNDVDTQPASVNYLDSDGDVGALPSNALSCLFNLHYRSFMYTCRGQLARHGVLAELTTQGCIYIGLLMPCS
jgi:hypothetical protein